MRLAAEFGLEAGRDFAEEEAERENVVPKPGVLLRERDCVLRELPSTARRNALVFSSSLESDVVSLTLNN